MGTTANKTRQDPSKLSDEEIVAGVIAGEGNRYIGVLYSRYSDKIFRRSISFVKEQAIAEDLTHDIFMKILLNLGSFKGKSKFSTWIYSITYNYCIDFLRKRQKERVQASGYSQEFDGIEDSSDDFEGFRQMKVERLQKLLDMVTVDDKMILLMKYRDSLSIKQIQEVYGISESAVKMRINRAKGKVKKLYRTHFKEV